MEKVCSIFVTTPGLSDPSKKKIDPRVAWWLDPGVALDILFEAGARSFFSRPFAQQKLSPPGTLLPVPVQVLYIYFICGVLDLA